MRRGNKFGNKSGLRFEVFLVSDRVFLQMDSSLERLDFSFKISVVMKGLGRRELHEITLTGACLSRSLVRVESNWDK